MMNEVLKGPAAVAAGRAPLSQLTEVSRYNLFSLLYQDALTRSGIPLEQVIGIGELRPRNSQSRFYDPVELTEAIYAELYNVAKDLNTPLSKKMVGSGLNGVRAALTNPNFGNFFRDVMRRYNNRLSERGVERRLFENDEFKSAELQDLIEGVYTRLVMDAGYHGVYVSPMSDNGGRVYEMDDSKYTEAGISGGLVQEAIIFNVAAVNENIVKFEDVEPLINSRIAAGKTRVKNNGELSTDLQMNDKMRGLEGELKMQQIDDYLDNYDSEIQDFRSDPPAKVDPESQMSRFQHAYLSIMEFFYDKFYRALRYRGTSRRLVAGVS